MSCPSNFTVKEGPGSGEFNAQRENGVNEVKIAGICIS